MIIFMWFVGKFAVSYLSSDHKDPVFTKIIPILVHQDSGTSPAFVSTWR